MQSTPGKTGSTPISNVTHAVNPAGHPDNLSRSGARKAGRLAGKYTKSSGTSGSHVRASPALPGSFAGHYGHLVISEGVAPIPKALFLYQGALDLSPQEVWFISYVLSYKWDGDLPHPRLQELAQSATLGLRQIKKIKSSIVEAGLLEVSSRYGAEGEQDANSYDFGLLFDRLEDLILADPSSAPDEIGDEDVYSMPGINQGDVAEENDSQAGASSPLSTPSQPYKQSLSDTSAARKAALTTSDASSTSRRDYSFAARYGRLLLRRGLAAIPKALFTYQADMGLSPQQMWFIGYILSFQWSTDLPYPSLRKMAQNTGYSERQIHRIKDSLVSAGHLRVIERHGANGRDTTSAYDFSPLLKAVGDILRNPASGEKERKPGSDVPPHMADISHVRTESPSGETQPTLRAASHSAAIPATIPATKARQTGGEPCVSGGVKYTSVGHEVCVSGGVKCASAGGVNCMSVGRVNCTSYELESIKKETVKEEPHQQQAENNENNENDEYHEDPDEQEERERDDAYAALLDVGVIPNMAEEIANRISPDHVFAWVRYYLSVLCKQDNLRNPLGVLVSRLRRNDEPPCVPTSGELQSLRLQLSRYR